MGKALQGVPRASYYLCTKVGCYGELDGVITDRFNYNASTALRSFEESLKRLGVDYVDILYVAIIDAMIEPEAHGHFIPGSRL